MYPRYYKMLSFSDVVFDVIYFSPVQELKVHLLRCFPVDKINYIPFDYLTKLKRIIFY
jgi:hypothetical protein